MFANKPAGSSSGFGSSSAQPSASSVFGSNLNTTQTQTQPQSGNLFGNTAGTSSVFGASLTPAATSTSGTNANQQSTSVFGGNNIQPTTASSVFGNNSAQPATASSVFGNNNAQPAMPSLFGGNNNQPAASSSLFGGNNTQQVSSSSLFGGTVNKPSTGASQFGSINTTPAPQSGIFGLSAYPANQLPSLLQASQFRQSQSPAPFAGRLTMGQGNAAPPAQVAGGVEVHVNDLRGTTRLQDCDAELRRHFEDTDKMIAKQEEFCRQIQAILGKHQENMDALEPSVDVVKDKLSSVEAKLVEDAQAVMTRKTVAQGDEIDFVRCQRVIENLKLPAHYQMPNSADADTDLVGNYFMPMVAGLQSQLNSYATSLTEVEAHMKVVEELAVTQTQHLASRGGSSAQDTERELMDTLVGFEQSIMTVGRTIGQCRDGIHEFVLARLGERERNMR
ncbi:hypothetical protein K470DRAFT_281783 [Piedraia hortae CBS 480.64]|uniref:Nucleoporin NSP1-like C-terminal domain-containing protein n=1 Tax=Piedraia hortae CBS 480.64 TaxID=1314780 RepID=A0A6A7C0K1_9PEZI|nr:hypothetical protein K470DRAFT_281783 [Piedraia hortae CBS 480.64]